MRHLLIVFSISLLSSCGILHVNEKYDPAKHAIIRGTFVRKGYFNWESYGLRKVDGERVIYLRKVEEQVVVSPGPHQLETDVTFCRPGGRPPITSYTHLALQAKAGHEYELMGKIEGDDVELWVQDKANGEKVTETVDSRIALPTYN